MSLPIGALPHGTPVGYVCGHLCALTPRPAAWSRGGKSGGCFSVVSRSRALCLSWGAGAGGPDAEWHIDQGPGQAWLSLMGMLSSSLQTILGSPLLVWEKGAKLEKKQLSLSVVWSPKTESTGAEPNAQRMGWVGEGVVKEPGEKIFVVQFILEKTPRPGKEHAHLFGENAEMCLT